ncbi:hypothetical protein MMC13_002385 [Lambiella insularis]|nr:hypothetical protein [Lambiella insularis]
MAEDVEFHGDFAQFRSLSRCEACAAGNHKCVMQESDESCMTCAGAGRKCVFVRTISVSGPKALFPWLSLLGQKRGLIRMTDLELAQLVQDKVLSLTALTPVINRLASDERAIPRHDSPEFSNYESMGAPSRRDTRNLGADSPAQALARSRTFPRIDGPSRNGSLFYQSSLTSPVDANTMKDVLRRPHSSSSSDRPQSRAGLDPSTRDRIRHELLLNFREQDEQADLATKNAQIAQWLSYDDSTSEIVPKSPIRSRGSSRHRRSSSVRSAPGRELSENTNGVLPNQLLERIALTSPPNNEADRSESDPTHIIEESLESPPASVGPTDDILGLPSQEAFPWVEPIRFPGYSSAPGQPPTSNAAMMRFASRAADVETASHAASWGTDARRRSIEDLDRILGPSGFLSRFNTSDNQVAMQVNLASEKLVSIFTQSSKKTAPRPTSTPQYNKNSNSESVRYAKPSPQRRKDELNSPTVRLRGIMPAIQPAPLAPRRVSTVRAAAEDDDVDSDGAANDAALLVNFTPWKGSIIPTLEGFKINVRDVNPQMAAYLVDRIGQEQLRRYKNLLLAKITHARAKQLQNCPSGTHCVDQGGTTTYLAPAKALPKSPSTTIKALQTSPALYDAAASATNPPETDDDNDDQADDTVIAAQFPAGFPLPPVKSLPAHFECPFCFQTRTFQKPSDWSKHVHEDLQPFTCTFPTCPDPKSFKRKADWIRHENERHRQLERWACSENGCSHVCYRRDNFVQHLVREHKYPEPRAKSSKPACAVRGAEKTRTDELSPQDKIVRMVDSCKVETTKTPAEEPCRFCGNVCASWKKLAVHLARHMEQISAPVLELVRQKDVTPDTIIAPIERAGG